MWNNRKFVRKNIPWQILEEHALLLAPTQGEAHELNQTATWVWQQLEGLISYSDLLDRLCEQFEVVREQADQDLNELLEMMLAKGIVECR